MTKTNKPKINYDKFGDDDWKKTFRLPTTTDIELSRSKSTDKTKPRQ